MKNLPGASNSGFHEVRACIEVNLILLSYMHLINSIWHCILSVLYYILHDTKDVFSVR
jgi:hypothetical protein